MSEKAEKPQKSGKNAKRTRKKSKAKNHQTDSGKGLQVKEQQHKAPGTVEVLPPNPNKENKGQHGGQNKIIVDDMMLARAEKCAGMGMNNGFIAGILGMHKETLRMKCLDHPELALVINRGRAIGINNIAQRLYTKATQGDDTKAQIFFLETVGGYNKTNEIEIAGADGGPVQLENKWTIEIIQPKNKDEGGNDNI